MVQDLVLCRKLWLLSSENSAAPLHGLCLVLQLSSIEVNGTELQCHTQPVDMCGALLGQKQPCFSKPGLSLLSCNIKRPFPNPTAQCKANGVSLTFVLTWPYCVRVYHPLKRLSEIRNGATLVHGLCQVL